MKKFYFPILLILIFTTLTYNVAFAQNYTYFDIVKTNYPDDIIASDNITYVGNVYYMSKRNGGLFYSHDAKSWHFIDGSDDARVISDKKSTSDALIVFYKGHLVKSYDGANFDLMHTFLPDTVVRYDNGIYTAFEKTSADDSYAHLYCSLDGENWVKLFNDKVLDGRFTISQYTNQYIINGINTSNATVCAILDLNLQVQILPYDYVSYDMAKNIYAAIKKEDTGVKLYSSNDINKDFTLIKTPVKSSTLASYYNGSFYIATVNEDNFYDVYKCSDTINWELSDIFYMPLYKTVDKDGNLQEAFLWHTCSANTAGIALLKTNKNGTSHISSVFIPDGLKLSLYGSVFAITTNDKPTNLISTDAQTWHQVDEASAFSILNAHSQRGDFMFVDKTNDKTIFKPKGDPLKSIEQNGIEVCIDGHYIAFDSAPIIKNDRTLVPIRAIAEALGAKVSYDDKTKNITINIGDDTINLTVGSDIAYITYFDGAHYEAKLEVQAQIINDRTLVPLRFIGETFNKNVEWEAEKKTVWIVSK